MKPTAAEKRELQEAAQRHEWLVKLQNGERLPIFRDKPRLNWRKEVSGVWLQERRIHFRKLIPQWGKPAIRTWKHYRETVYTLSELQPLHLLPNIEKRTPFGWHLDHVMSVWQGFRSGIPAEVTAHISNLRVIPAAQNKAKGRNVVYTNLFNEGDPFSA